MNLMEMEEMHKCRIFLQKKGYCLKLEHSNDVADRSDNEWSVEIAFTEE